jgi:hypothetical protein
MKPERLPVAAVRELWRFPVKSMSGQQLQTAKLGWNGFAGDRRYAFHKVDSRSGLPFLSAREQPDLILYKPEFRDPENPDGEILVRTPSGQTFDLYDPMLCTEIQSARGGEIRVMNLWRGSYDSMPVSLITLNSIASTNTALGRTEGMETARFRANVVLEALEPKQYPEDKWVGKLLVLGESTDPARIRVDRKDVRCAIVNLNPTTAHADIDILKQVVAARKNFLGVYGTTQRPGTIKVGDLVFMTE